MLDNIHPSTHIVGYMTKMFILAHETYLGKGGNGSDGGNDATQKILPKQNIHPSCLSGGKLPVVFRM